MNRLILLAVLAVVILGLWTSYIYMVPPTLPEYEGRKADEYAKELGYIPGEILIELKPGSINLDSNKGMRDFLSFLEDKSVEYTPIIAETLLESGKLNQGDVTDQWLEEMKRSLFTYGRKFSGSNGGLIILAIDNAAQELSDLLKEEEIVDGASPNYLGSFD